MDFKEEKEMIKKLANEKGEIFVQGLTQNLLSTINMIEQLEKEKYPNNAALEELSRILKGSGTIICEAMIEYTSGNKDISKMN